MLAVLGGQDDHPNIEDMGHESDEKQLRELRMFSVKERRGTLILSTTT